MPNQDEFSKKVNELKKFAMELFGEENKEDILNASVHLLGGFMFAFVEPTGYDVGHEMIDESINFHKQTHDEREKEEKAKKVAKKTVKTKKSK